MSERTPLKPSPSTGSPSGGSAPLDATLRAPGSVSGAPSEAVVGESVSRPQDKFGKFLRDRRLGAGGMGEVWKAWDTELRRWVALKFLLGGDPEQIARFQAEARTAGSLNHPNIASIYEVGSAQDRHFIAMQFVDGQTLKTFPRGDRKALARLARDAARAVASAHEKGIVHRDLKPENLMVVTRDRSASKSGASGIHSDSWEHHLYVMDFGLAKSVDGARSLSGAIVGTPSYMPPEQSRGRPVDATADVYSLGATLYELLTNRPPFSGESVYEILRKVQEEDPRPPRRLDPEIEEDLETIVMKCLEKDPARRYPTASALADDLDRWLEDEPIAAHPPSFFYRVRKYVARRRGVVATAALAAITIAVLAAAFVPRWLADRAAGRKAEALREVEAARNRRQEAAHLRLSTLWATIVERKTEQRRLMTPPSEAWRALSEAVRSLDEYIAEWPDEPQGYYVRARGRLYLSQFESAESDLSRALQIAPDFRQGWSLLGSIRFQNYMQSTYGVVEEVNRKREEAQPILVSALDAFSRGGGGKPDAGEAGRWGMPWTREDEIGRKLTEAVQAREDRNRMVELLKQAFDQFHAEEYARLLGNWGPEDQQILWFDRAVQLAPGYGEAWSDRAYTKLLRKDFQGAFADYSKAIEVSVEENQPWFQRAVVRTALGDTSGALADYTQALKLSPGYVDAVYNRGILRRDLDDVKGASEDFTSAINLKPGHLNALENRAFMRYLLEENDAAIADCDAVLARQPDRLFVHKTRGLVRAAKGNHAGAAEDFVTIAIADPSDSYAASRAAVETKSSGNSRPTLESYDRALALHPRDADLLVNRGLLKKCVEDFAGAIADCEQALQVNPQLTRAFVVRGLARLGTHDKEGARRDFGEALRLAPSDVMALVNRGNLLRKEGALDEALLDLDKAVLLHPAHFDARMGRAYLRRDMKDLKGAEEDLDAALGINYRDLAARNLRGLVRAARGDRQRALADFETLLSMDPQNVQTLVNRGDLRKEAADLEGASADYETALKLEPRCASALYSRGVLRLAKGDQAGAKADFEQVLQVASKGSEDFQSAKKALDEMGR